jgi:hypothetical protein
VNEKNEKEKEKKRKRKTRNEFQKNNDFVE